ncbi:MAG: O-antigen ligase family protein [Actinomycetota bacterium]|nr:O-antigen ligase family protein [Actinomycetota bacterium]
MSSEGRLVTLAPPPPLAPLPAEHQKTPFGLLEWAMAGVIVQTLLFNPVIAESGTLQVYMSTLTWPMAATAGVVRWSSGRDPELTTAGKSLMTATAAFLWLVLFWIGFGPAQPHSVGNLLRLLYVPIGMMAALAVFRSSDRLLDIAVVALGLKGAILLAELVQGPIDILHRLTVPELGGHNTFGAFVVFVVVLRGSTWALASQRPHPAVMASLVICLGCILLTFSRAAFLALVTGLAALTVCVLWRSGRARQSRMAALLLLGAALSPLLVAGPLQDRLTQIGLARSSGRSDLWRPAWEGFVSQPLVGKGFGSFEAYSSAVVDLADPHRVGGVTYSAHNLVFQILYEGGLVGLALIGWAAWLVLRRCWHPVLAPVTVAFLADSLFETFPYVVQVSWVMGLVLAVGLSHRAASEPVAATRDPG